MLEGCFEQLKTRAPDPTRTHTCFPGRMLALHQERCLVARIIGVLVVAKHPSKSFYLLYEPLRAHAKSKHYFYEVGILALALASAF